MYGLIGWTINLSLQDKHNALPSKGYVGTGELHRPVHQRHQRPVRALAEEPAASSPSCSSVGAILLGLFWALLLERGARAEGFFRTIYLFPMAVSFVASGVVWRWLMNTGTGDNAGGLNAIFSGLGLAFLENRWWTHPDWGMAAMALPAIWQLAGYMMALFLAGFRGIPHDLREAALMDGTSTYQLYRHVLFPQLTPVALSPHHRRAHVDEDVRLDHVGVRAAVHHRGARGLRMADAAHRRPGQGGRDLDLPAADGGAGHRAVPRSTSTGRRSGHEHCRASWPGPDGGPASGAPAGLRAAVPPQPGAPSATDC